MKKTILIAAVMFFALSVSAMAQQGATFTVGSVPVTTVASCGLTEKTGDVTFTTVPASPNTTTGTITITYPVAITVPASFVDILPATSTVTVQTVANNAAGQGVVVLNVPGGLVVPQTFTLTGVRVAIAGSGLSTVNATISTTGNALVAGQTTVNVINSIANALGTPVAIPLSINAATGTGLGPVNLTIPEGYLNAFGVTAATDPTQTGAVAVRLTVAALPTGVSLSFPTTAGDFTLTDAVGTPLTAAQIVTAVGGQVYYTLTTDTNPTSLDSLVIPVTVARATGASFPLGSGPVTISATAAPIGTAFGAFGAVLVPPAPGSSIPRFAGTGCEVGPATIATVVPANTILLIPYAVNTVGYNTGIAIANTTSDPGTTAMGVTRAVAQNGAMTFYFFPQTGSSFTYTTSATSPGTGLSSGVLNSGRIYTVLLSELLAAAQAPADFSGYIFVITNFTNAHGQYFISDFEAFTNGSLMLVVTANRNGANEALNQ